MSAPLGLTPTALRLLNGLILNPRKQAGGRVRGTRLTRKRGVSIEFRDFRDYAEGDDLRHLDWNALARFDVPVLKTYQDEEDLPVHVWLDGSASMYFGTPSKMEVARQFAQALGLIGLAGGDTVYARWIGTRQSPAPPLRGRSQSTQLASYWGAARPITLGGPSLAAELRQLLKLNSRPGLLILCTDGLDPELPDAIKAIGGRGHELLMLNVLSTMELDPDLEGDLILTDVEGRGTRELTANSQNIRAYRQNLENHLNALKEATLRVGGRYGFARSDTPFEDVFRDVIRGQGWVQ